MIERIKDSWRLFASGRPGLRFRERYRLHQSRKRGGFDFRRLLHVVGGAVLIVASAFFGWLPVLGWGTAILGLSMIASESHAVARLLDQLEVRARKLFGPSGKAVSRLPGWVQLSVSLAIALFSFALVFGLFSLTFG